MQAITYTEFGPPLKVLKLTELEKPAPKENEVLIKVAAASVNAADVHYTLGTPFIVRAEAGLRKPKNSRTGIDLAGRVEAVGASVTQFKPGDEVYGIRTGAFAEYVVKVEKTLVLKPANLTMEQAAAIPVAACTALQGLRDKGGLQPGQTVLINGAAGGVGTFAVQIAKALGGRVTAVTSTPNVEQARALGAERVIDYKHEDFTRVGQRYDLILDNVGNRSLAALRRVLSPTGKIVMVAGPVSRMITTMVMGRLGNKSLVAFVAAVTKADLLFLKELAEAGKLTPVIERRYALNEVPEAIRYLEAGHARGKVVIYMDGNGKA
ncbi:MAG: NAD(P)-dependent alcohol dehydrogenase [Anaerolineales bacterium]